MLITITHDQHFRWVTLHPGEHALGTERVRPVRAGFDLPLEALRLVTVIGNTTTVNIPDDAVDRMTKDVRDTEERKVVDGKLVRLKSKPKSEHRLKAISRHLIHAVHDANRVPVFAWKDIHVEGDDELEAFLKSEHLRK